MNDKSQFVRRYIQLFPDFEESIELRKSLRLNTLKMSDKEILNRLRREKVKLEKIPMSKFGYYYEAEFSLGSTPEYLLGYYFLQEASSQIPVEILDPCENDLVLDMCAAPGSKTTQIAQYMNNKGCIVALDNQKWRLLALRNNLERLGISNVIIYNKDARFVRDYKQEYDKILLDAPCSGNMFTDCKWHEKRDVASFKERSRLQKELLKTAVKVLKKNGTLIYSTCTLEPEENEEVIEWALNNLDIELQDIKMKIGSSGLTKVFDKELNPEIKKTKRLLPWQDKMPPFYIANIKKK
jgi:NOL1/NOP2/sun family putative RNA methylase